MCCLKKMSARIKEEKKSGGLPLQDGPLPPDLDTDFIPSQEAGCPRGIVPHQERLACRTNPNVFQPCLQP
jgi:hypothetical protein